MQKFYLPLVVALTVFAAGCGVKAQTYVMTKERADQGTAGNAGCLAGACAPVPATDKTTRKMYVLELSKPLPESEIKKIEQTTSSSIVETAAPSQNKIVIPPSEETSALQADASLSEAQTYVVEKDDTLQKVAKKFYNSYGKWTVIYEANKEKIKNPNFLKPGTELTIPAN